jgi:hypothetical protein
VNENQLRKKMFSDPQDVDKYRPNLEDIYGSAAYSQRARVVLVLHRPRDIKKRLFPELTDAWENELDIIKCAIAKQSDGDLSVQEFLFDPSCLRVVPYYKTEDEIV